MRLTVFGANGPTGRLLVTQALDAGHAVTAVTRRPETFPLRHAALTVEPGNVSNPDHVDRAVAGADAVLSALGAPFGRRPVRVYSLGADHVVAAMQRHGVRRFAATTALVLDPRAGAEGGRVARTVTTAYSAAEGFLADPFTARADLAAFLLAQVDDDRFVRRVVAVTTPSAQQHVLGVLLRERVLGR